MKSCIQCKIEKPFTEFYRDGGCADGFRSNCKRCKDAKTLEWRDKNREKYNSDQRAHHKKHYKRDRLRRYGLTPEQYDSMLMTQDGLCAICKKPPQGSRPLAVDHCHKTGKVRGLLCYGCNRAIVILDDSELYASAANYLKS